MKKLTKLLSSVGILAVALSSGSALAYSSDVMDAAKSHDTAVKIRKVHYTCQSNGEFSVLYGFNNANLPTYAQAYLNGKQRFMPINLRLSDNVGTFFGDENNFSLGTGHLTLANYHKSTAQVQSPSSEILYKNCDVAWIHKVKG